jgi:hypothetical protein
MLLPSPNLVNGVSAQKRLEWTSKYQQNAELHRLATGANDTNVTDPAS